jgi:hypothetical protein
MKTFLNRSKSTLLRRLALCPSPHAKENQDYNPKCCKLFLIQSLGRYCLRPKLTSFIDLLV